MNAEYIVRVVKMASRRTPKETGGNPTGKEPMSEIAKDRI